MPEESGTLSAYPFLRGLENCLMGKAEGMKGRKGKDGPQKCRAAEVMKKMPNGSVLVGVIIVLIFLALLVTAVFYKYIDYLLFEERRIHLAEITEKITQVVDTVTEVSWERTEICGNLLQLNAMQDEAAVLENLDMIEDFLSSDDTTVLALEEGGEYYTSNGKTGVWEGLAGMADLEKEQQIIITKLPYEEEERMIFIKRLPEKEAVGNTGRYLTHIAAAVSMDSMQVIFKVKGFGTNFYTYIINNEGRDVYHNGEGNSVIDSNYLLSSMGKYKFVHGGTLEDLENSINEGRSDSYEFEYRDRSYFVSTAPVFFEEWTVLVFVPTAVLSASTSKIMGIAAIYFVVIALIIVLLFSATVFSITKSRGDKRMLKQQEEAKRKLAKTAKEARAASAAKSAFLSHMSHDIRTPINGIMGMTGIAMKNLEDKEQVEECLKKIDDSSSHLLSLVNDVLDMSRIESGKTTIKHEVMDLRLVLENCASIIGGQLLERDVEFVTEFDGIEHPWLLGDELHLRQVLINILGNAVKFTPDGGKILFFVEETPCDESQAVFRFEITDTGIGMDEAFIEHIWEPFTQEENGGRTSYKGTGLGMTITKQFVELMGGIISVESRLNEGSSFVVELPMEITDKAPVQETAAEHGELTGIKVLLVEDNELNVEIARYLLEEEGISVVNAENGKRAVELFAESEPGDYDAILMDVMMPVMDGLEATRQIRALERADAAEIPIIAMTANAYEEDMRKTKEAGMNAHLTKPLNMEALLNALADYTGRGKPAQVTGGNVS